MENHNKDDAVDDLFDRTDWPPTDSSRAVVVGTGSRSEEFCALLQREAGITVIASGPNHPGDPSEGLARVGTEPDTLEMDVKGFEPDRVSVRRGRLGWGMGGVYAAAMLAAAGDAGMAAEPVDYNLNTGRNRSRHLNQKIEEQNERLRKLRDLDAARRAGVSKKFAAAYDKPPTEADRVAIEKAEAKRARRAARNRKVTTK